MPEAVRLVIWDLDETFWRGTVTEGGITQYIQAHHDMVVELAKRGIMSSICSKNDEETILKILRNHQILDYFIFPSIAWLPKGQRIANLIETVQLRPATVMFIDDNPNNLAEALSITPDLQVADEKILIDILNDPRFKGKDDTNFSRLNQYKLLEARKSDQIATTGTNEDFLRTCDVRVYIEYEVARHIERAIELINRTNQLNFTKIRLPEDDSEAKQQLQAALDDHFRQCGLVRVVDKYGDYGFVGFFMLKNSATADPKTGKLTRHLEHYCFSCRTLGMLIEQWLYDKLQRPGLKIVGEVLTDLSAPRQIDWIRQVVSLSETHGAIQKIGPEIRIHGCEANSIAHYLGAYSDKVKVSGNFHAGTTFVRVNSAPLLLSASDRWESAFEAEAEQLGIPVSMLRSDFFQQSPAGTLFVFGGQLDVDGSIRYRHKIRDWEICIEPHGLGSINLVDTPVAELSAYIEALPFKQPAKEEIARVGRHVRANYAYVKFQPEKSLENLMKVIFDRIPVGSKLVLVADHTRFKRADGSVVNAPWVQHYRDRIQSMATSIPFVGVVSFDNCVANDDEIHVGGNHYDRMVYLRMAQHIIAMAQTLSAKAAETVEHNSMHYSLVG